MITFNIQKHLTKRFGCEVWLAKDDLNNNGIDSYRIILFSYVVTMNIKRR